jgi:hypothetical protein
MAFDLGYALVIGVGSYKYVPKANIPISVADANKIKDLLCDQKLCGYLPDHVTLLHDQDATRDGILNALNALAKEADAENTVLIYYCGHGEYGADGDYYLTTHDTEVDKNKVMSGTGVSEVELLAALRNIRAKRILFLLNACHSGEVSPELGIVEQAEAFGDVSIPEKVTEAILSTGEGRIIITACRPEQKSWIGAGKLSIFTQALVDGLSGKGLVQNKNGYVSAFDLYEHMFFAIKDAAEKLGKVQEAELTILRGVGPYPVSLYRGATDLGFFDAEDGLPEDTATRQVEKGYSQRVLKNYTIRIEKMTGGFVQQGFKVGGDVIQATRDIIDNSKRS